ncbi:MAG: hypothetical protein A3H70_02175 [Candidatus Komeilibacteria bacterium RIFCSPLOWO2_02_FULL_48_11]|uniref:RNA polymerase sigma-70 domain-containing protein n=1 Tax=Candidatus Komeilibacteria bacterium RIFCSPLOWO2_02_FULL_48_11 TaxID=1798553 RepID=A0A1G2BTM4_9BACT|nr:MAG: hypothetical protein A3H70_02175 [Candidatus Komeilibacteria bacterium RIFCSPLOWO2_02_FULL_48_11]
MSGLHIQSGESLDLYLRELASLEPLSADEEVALAKLIHEGDQKARDKLVRANLRFVISAARQYQNRGLPLADLIGAGNIGLMTAVERFDGTRGFKFISYAVWWIRQAIQQALAEDVRTIHLPLNRVDELRRISRVRSELENRFSREVRPEEIAAALDLPVEHVLDTLNAGRAIFSLDASFSEDGDSNLLSVLEDDSQPEPDEFVISEAFHGEIQKVLKSLSPREAKIVDLYFGISSGDGITLEEIGARFDLTRERVRQIKEMALKKLRHPTRRRQLEPLLDEHEPTVEEPPLMPPIGGSNYLISCPSKEVMRQVPKTLSNYKFDKSIVLLLTPELAEEWFKQLDVVAKYIVCRYYGFGSFQPSPLYVIAATTRLTQTEISQKRREAIAVLYRMLGINAEPERGGHRHRCRIGGSHGNGKSASSRISVDSKKAEFIRAVDALTMSQLGRSARVEEVVAQADVVVGEGWLKKEEARIVLDQKKVYV